MNENEMTIEEIKAVYFDADALKEPTYHLYQLNTDGYRYYYRFDDNGEPVFYPSVTTMLHAVMPMPFGLLDWYIANGKEAANEIRDLAAAYGTFMHAQFERVIINRTFDFDDVPNLVAEYMERENIPDKMFTEWCGKIRKDVLAFSQFIKDYQVKPLAIEIGLCSHTYHYAGMVDMPCIMTDGKGNSFPAIVDFKSGRKGFTEDHELQLGLYRDMWNENFPDMPIERIFNFSPKDWRKSPTYNLKEQTQSGNLAKIPHLLALAAIEDEKRNNDVMVIKGKLDLDSDLDDNILVLSLSELIKQKTEAEKSAETPQNSADVVQGI